MDLTKVNAVAQHLADTENGSRKINYDLILQHDADFDCYECADLTESVKANLNNLVTKLQKLRKQAGAFGVNAHITLGEKSGREGMATVKEYQLNRDPDAPIKVRVRELRKALADNKERLQMQNIGVVANYFREADDSLATYQNTRIRELGVQSSIISSGDKDLWMVEGQHMDPKSGRIWEVKGYGRTMYRDVGNVKPKLVGEGTSWFWHQMIVGDTVDNIPGLPKLHNSLMDKYFPLKSGKSRKDGLSVCGEAKAVGLLKDVTDDSSALFKVLDAYFRTYGIDEYKERFVEQAYLLWMQREDTPLDVLSFLNSFGQAHFRFDPQQTLDLQTWLCRRGSELPAGRIHDLLNTLERHDR